MTRCVTDEKISRLLFVSRADRNATDYLTLLLLMRGAMDLNLPT
jgi:hypothetical protein